MDELLFVKNDLRLALEATARKLRKDLIYRSMRFWKEIQVTEQDFDEGSARFG